MKIVVTGSSGSLAEGIIALTLTATSHSLVLVDQRAPATRLSDPRVQYVTADLRDYKTFLQVLEGADGLIHLAAFPNPNLAHSSEIHNVNVSLSFNALTAAVEASVLKVVMASS